MKATESIFLEGILLRKGGKNLDFSDGYGFYMSEDFKVSASFAKASNVRNKHCIVMLFFVIEKKYCKTSIVLNCQVTIRCINRLLIIIYIIVG